MIKLCLDYGHGGNDQGASYKGRKEKDDVLKAGLAVAKELRRHGIAVDETRTSDTTVSLGARSNFEKKGSYDYFISLHRNAYQPEVGQGVEVYTYTKQSAKARSLADKVQKALVGVGFRDRGVKKANFHVLRETKAPAILVEIGFIDNNKDNQIFDSKFDGIKECITKAILDELSIKYIPLTKPVPESNNKTLYRVMAGSYTVRENADRQVEKLRAAGFDATVMIFNQ
ncbi:MAG TPA: N-acetylmuramoyl-L-alanine amidase [Epulopiscium sp.]|nr:N-acetylmuramoyl-L-alanine amidase [Candidatus Epulonipiscium sp.]